MSEKDNIHSFSNEVHLEWINNRMLVVFLNEVIICNISIPKGFITDGATIPKLFWNILSPFGRFFKPLKQKSQISLVFGMNALVPLGTIKTI